MSWFRIDDAFLDHPKMQHLERAGARMWADGAALWLAIGLQCNRNLTDGTLPMDRVYRATPLAKKRVKQVLPVLVQAGLLTIEDDLVRVHDYLEYQASKSEVMAKRKAGAARTRKSRAAVAPTPPMYEQDHEQDHEQDPQQDHEQKTEAQQNRALSPNVTVLPTAPPYPSQGKGTLLPPQQQKVSGEEEEEKKGAMSVDLRSREGVSLRQAIAFATHLGVTPQLGSLQQKKLVDLCSSTLTRDEITAAVEACRKRSAQPPSMGFLVSKIELHRKDAANGLQRRGNGAAHPVAARDSACLESAQIAMERLKAGEL